MFSKVWIKIKETIKEAIDEEIGYVFILVVSVLLFVLVCIKPLL